MNNLIWTNAVRTVVLIAVQVLILKQVSAAMGTYVHLFLYPLAILFLPLNTPSSAAILIGATVGFIVDAGYTTPGVHASSLAFSAFVRPLLFAAFEPKGGFSSTDITPSPVNISWQTFLFGAAFFYFSHFIWYFSVSEFTIIHMGTSLLKTIVSMLGTFVLVILYLTLFKTKI